MTAIADISAAILAEEGETVTYTRAAESPSDIMAVVTRHGIGPCPLSWPIDLFQNQSRHALVRLAAADVPDEPTRDDVITLDGQDYKVRQVLRSPETGPDVLWWLCRCASGQRGKL